MATYDIGNITVEKLIEPAGGPNAVFGDTINAPGIDSLASGTLSIGITNATGMTIAHTGITVNHNAAISNFTNTVNFNGTTNLNSSVNLTTFTSGSILYAATSGVISQNNASLFWDNASARVGIGTNSPSTFLDVRGSVASTGVERIQNNSSSGYSALMFHDNSGNYQGELGFANASVGNTTLAAKNYIFTDTGGPDWLFQYHNTPRMTIGMASGNVNIGPLQTDPGFLLQVQGTSHFTGTSLFSSNVVISGSNSAPESLTLQKGNNGSDVTVQWNNTSAAAKGWIGVIGTATDFVNEGVADDFFIRAQSDLLFTTNTSGVERMRITSDGGIQVRASTSAVSVASTGRIRYNSTSQHFETSENTGAYQELGKGITNSANASDFQLTTTSPTTVITYTAPAAGNYLVYTYYRVATATTDVTITLTWTDQAGAQTADIVPVATSTAVGTYTVVPFLINTTASAITLTATTGTANNLFVSASIMRLT